MNHKGHIMDINCFTFTYKTLMRKGYKFPVYFEGYSLNDLKPIIVDYQKILDEKIHYAYFDSFCHSVKIAKKDDVIVHKDGVGIAVNNILFISILANPKRKVLRHITNKHTIMRIGEED